MTSRIESVSIIHPDGTAEGERRIPIEIAVAIEVDGLGYAVMMMTPADLVAFATGFMLTERLADSADDVIDIDPFEAESGWIVRVTLSERSRGRIHDRVRHRTGDTSCGLCGISSLEQLRKTVPHLTPRPEVRPEAIFAALAALRGHQPLNAATGAIHAAAACDPAGGIVATYEDVGRHNALDKLVGGLAGHAAAATAFILVTSRISFEMVDKALIARTPMLVGISAPTSLAVDHARAHGLTLLALARADAVLVLNDPWAVFGSEGGT